MPNETKHKEGCLINGIKLLRRFDLIQYKGYKNPIYVGEFECPSCGKPFLSPLNVIQRKRRINCGCNTDHRCKHGKCKHKTHGIWSNIKNRCHNPKNKWYKNYGARGISMCEEWRNDFAIFYDWCCANGYEEGLEMDRIDNDGNYEPSNCRFISHSKNNQNTRLLRSCNTSGYRGVSFNKVKNRWQMHLISNKKLIAWGTYMTAVEGAIAYNDAVIKHKTLHPLNIIPETTSLSSGESQNTGHPLPH